MAGKRALGIWVVLVLGAALVLGRLAWTVFRKAVALLHELGEAGERASAIAAQVERIGQDPGDVRIAVFDDPHELRRSHRRRRRDRRRVRARRRATRA